MVRAGDDNGGGRGTKRARPQELGQYAFKVLLPDGFVANLMGNKGAGVHEIEDATQTHLQFSPRGDYYPETQLRICIVSGAEPQFILDALAFMCDQFIGRADEDKAEGRTESDFFDDQGRTLFRCALHKSAAGAIIGTKGERVKALRESTGARVDIDRDPHEHHQAVNIAGDRDQILNVLEELSNVVQADSDSPWFGEWAQQRSFGNDGKGGKGKGGKGDKDGKKKRGRKADGGPYRAADEHQGCIIFVGRLGQATTKEGLQAYFERFGEVVASDVRTDPKTGRSKGFGFITFASPHMVEDVFNHQGHHEVDGRRVDCKPYGEEEGGDDGGGYEQERGFSPPRGYSPPRHDEFRGGGHKGKGGGKDKGPPMDDLPRDINWFGDLASDVPREYTELDYSITCQLPSNKCGALIGKRGSNIDDVQRTTGATVTVAKKEDNEGPEAYRAVTIVGPLLSVYGAHMMLMRSYNDAEAQFEASRAAAAAQPNVEDLQRQIAELSAQVKQVTKHSTGGGGKGGNKGGRRR